MKIDTLMMNCNGCDYLQAAEGDYLLACNDGHYWPDGVPQQPPCFKTKENPNLKNCQGCAALIDDEGVEACGNLVTWTPPEVPKNPECYEVDKWLEGMA
jgi:hypothetical protein